MPPKSQVFSVDPLWIFCDKAYTPPSHRNAIIFSILLTFHSVWGIILTRSPSGEKQKSKSMGVKCRRDGELPVGRRNADRSVSCGPCFASRFVRHKSVMSLGLLTSFLALCSRERRYFYYASKKTSLIPPIHGFRQYQAHGLMRHAGSHECGHWHSLQKLPEFQQLDFEGRRN